MTKDILTLSDLGNKLLVASHNEGKVREIKSLLAQTPLEIISAKDLNLDEPVEDGDSFEANALIKARACCKASALPALSDDSGLCVDALNGDPGIYSARWAGEKCDFDQAMRMIEEKLMAQKATTDDQRTGRFVCVLALALPDGRSCTYRGEVEGHLIWPPRGQQGFGYDPIFEPIDGQKGSNKLSFGEMSAEEKHGWSPLDTHKALSHRARAFALLWREVFANTP